MKIIRPPKLYLDTAHLANIAKVRRSKALPTEEYRRAYEFIDECIRVKHFGLVFTGCSAVEWSEGRASYESALEIAEVIDSARLKYLCEPDSIVFAAEVLRECARQDSKLEVVDLPILHTLIAGAHICPAFGILASAVPDFFDPEDIPPHLKGSKPTLRVPVIQAYEWVQRAFFFKQNQPSVLKERIDGYRAAFEQDRSCADSGMKMGTRDRIEFLKRFARLDRILLALNPKCDVDAILERVELSRCPALRLWILAREQVLRAGKPPSDNDVDDWLFLQVVPYVDLVLTDRHFRAILIQADRNLASRVLADPPKAQKLLEAWGV